MFTETKNASATLGQFPKVSAVNVTKQFGDFVANRDICLDVNSGEFLTLLGPSGCGKSTLMRIIAGLETCDQGRILIDGRDITDEPPRKRGVGMVFQNYSLFPHMTVWENVAFGLRVHGVKQPTLTERVNNMLELVHLPGIAGRRPAELSGGQQQRVALARALATGPSLLMLDEPLGALDLKLRHQLQVELRRIHRETKVTFLFVTHDQGEALFLSDRIAVMRDGRIEQIDTPEKIYGDPVNSYVANFIGDVTLLPCRSDAVNDTRVRLLATDAAILLTKPASSRELHLVVRPEHVRIADANESYIVTSIEEVINEGSTTLLLLRLDDNTPLKSRIIGRLPASLARGSQLKVTIDPEVAQLPSSP